MQIRERVASAGSRNSLITVEGHATEKYFQMLFQLIPRDMRIDRRRTFKAYDGINNYPESRALLKWKVYCAMIKAKLEPYLGFLHSEQFGKPSLVCDLMELYRYLIDDFVIQYCKSLKKKDFAMNHEDYSLHRKGQRQYLKKAQAKDIMKKLNSFFESTVEIPRVRHLNKQTLETLINEEALLLAKYLRNESHSWVPRIAKADNFGKINYTVQKPGRARGQRAGRHGL